MTNLYVALKKYSVNIIVVFCLNPTGFLFILTGSCSLSVSCPTEAHNADSPCISEPGTGYSKLGPKGTHSKELARGPWYSMLGVKERRLPFVLCVLCSCGCSRGGDSASYVRGNRSSTQHMPGPCSANACQMTSTQLSQGLSSAHSLRLMSQATTLHPVPCDLMSLFLLLTHLLRLLLCLSSKSNQISPKPQ